MNTRIMGAILTLMMSNGRANADSPNTILKQYEQSVRGADKKFGGFSVDRGKELYFRKVQSTKGEMSCSTCHTTNPKSLGRTRANKDIDPIAPSANEKRFTDMKHVEKWFARNCDDVLRRLCSTQEKGDFITYLLSIK